MPTSSTPSSTSSHKPLISRYFSKPNSHPFEEVVWENRSSKIVNDKGDTIFELNDAEIPANWSQLATDIVVSKYFRKAGVPETGHEVSVKQVIKRIANTLKMAGLELGEYFDSEEEAELFEMELTHILVNQKGAFNSPVWFNLGLFHQYGVSGGSGNWYYDFDKGRVVEADNNYMRPQCSACFIQSCEDDLMKMLDLMKAEVRLFKYGSGSGTNFSKIRGRGEKISAGGKSSGLLSFLKVFDASAGSIKSGGTTRRAAKMVCLDMDHPEIVDFINWKVNEEKKVAALVAAGFSSDFNGEAYSTVTAQNANNSVRVTDEFMEAVEKDGQWQTINRTDGKVAGTYQARELWDMICHSAWQCADPGLQFDTTINNWHTCSNTDRINASNPCSEYMFLDDSACNLASINLMKFIDEDGSFDIVGYRHAARTLFIAQEILVDFSSYPTKSIAQNSHDYRPLGLGYANIGTLLMYKGIAYDSPEAMAITGALTAILTGHAYLVSAEMAARKGAFNGYEKNRRPMLAVINKHREAVSKIDSELCPVNLLEAAQEDWNMALELGEKYGYRNAQATVIAPTGTIGLLMDCDTTSIEPDFSLIKFKKLAGGGHLKIVNQSVPNALKNLGYTPVQVKEIIDYALGVASLNNSSAINKQSLLEKGITASDLVNLENQLTATFDLDHVFNAYNISAESLEALKIDEESFKKPNFNFLQAIGFTKKEIEEANHQICGLMTVEGAPHIKDEHLPIFDCANKSGKIGTRYIEPMGHVRIMAAAQPFISGAISKTVNLPFETTEAEISQIYFDSWKLGIKAVAMYRDGSKLSQPLNSSTKKDAKEEVIVEKTVIEYRSERRYLSDERQAVTHKFKIAGHKGYITVGMFDDGTVGEIFITMAKQGSVINGFMDAFATSISIALQYGVPLEVLVDKFSHVRFEPSGLTNNPNIRIAKSIVDYIFRWLGMRFLDVESQVSLGLNSDPDLIGNGYAAKAVDSVREKLNSLAAENTGKSSVKLEVENQDENVPVKVMTKFSFDVISDAPTCSDCGGMTIRNGACYVCRDCGSTTGCS